VKRRSALEATACTTSVWPTPSSDDEARQASPSLKEQEGRKAELESSSGAFQRLKLLMDTWCALWLWPLDECTELPTREA
jgi:hypothetical protein